MDEMIFSAINNFSESLGDGVAAVVKFGVPKGWGVVVSGCAFWYGKRVALTYAPGIVANYFINSTIVFTGSTVTGKALGITVVAPMFTPSVVPWVAFGVGCALFYTVAVICNLIQKYLLKKAEPKPEDGSLMIVEETCVISS
jgi:hypothetical protein